VPVKQKMASRCETRAVVSKDKSEDAANHLPVISSDESVSEASSGGNVLHDKKGTFRPPPRGLTPNEYVLCHR